MLRRRSRRRSPVREAPRRSKCRRWWRDCSPSTARSTVRTWPTPLQPHFAISSEADRRAEGGSCMKRRDRILAAAVTTAFISVVATVGGFAYGAPTGYLFCTASSPQHTADGSSQRAVTYFSATFATEDGNTRPASDAFLKYLEAKYAFKPLPDAPQPVICTSGNSLDDAQSLSRV